MPQTDLDFQLQNLIQRSEKINADSTNLISEVVGIVGGYITAQERNATDFRQRLAMLGQPRQPMQQQPQQWQAGHPHDPGNWRVAKDRIPS